MTSLFLTSCSTLNSNKDYPLPEKPVLVKVKFIPTSNGHYLTKEEATNLANNIDELKAYIEKLETLIEKMQKQ